MNTLDERARIVRCRACGHVWGSKSSSPRCPNRRCRSTRVLELGYEEIQKMIANLEKYIAYDEIEIIEDNEIEIVDDDQEIEITRD